jgi:hypothetical protein
VVLRDFDKLIPVSEHDAATRRQRVGFFHPTGAFARL